MHVAVVLPCRPPRSAGRAKNTEGTHSVLRARLSEPSSVVAVFSATWSKDRSHVLREVANATELPQQMYIIGAQR
jgi:hypothetical protein